jgi:hypothetical protein
LRRRTALIAWAVVVAAVVTLFLVWQYLGYRAARRTLPEGMTLAGVPADGMTREQALNVLEVNFATPLEVFYEDQQIPLAPETAGLQYDAPQTAANLDAVLRERGGFDGFVAHILNRPLGPVEVPVAISYSEERVDAFLARTAAEYDHPPQEAIPLPASLSFRMSQPGYEMDMAASRDRLVRGLVSAVEHQVRLVVDTEPAPPSSGNVLGQMIQILLEDHEGLIAGVFVKDLQTGNEFSLNEAVAYEGPGLLKVAVMQEVYRALDQPLSPQISQWLSDTIGVEDSNEAANLLLQDAIGGGDGYAGAESVSAAMRYLGLVNTFIAAPYDADASGLTISTPANSRTDITTSPEPEVQTTPLDAGLLLEMIYQCSAGGGPLLVAFPQEITVSECDEMLRWLSENRIDSFVEVGVPAGAQVGHKQGISADTHSDAAIVFGSERDFVLAVFLYRPTWLPWEESAPLISDIATAAYNYFNPTDPVVP